MAAETLPRIRSAGLAAAAVLVVRGDELDPVLLAEDASRFHERFPTWGRYGVSAFAAEATAEVDALCQSRLVRFATVAVFRQVDLEAAGIQIEPTFRTPHVTLCHGNLSELIERLLSCEHEVRVNPYTIHEEGVDP